ncbi:MAG TPA: hypothetical protein VHB93_01585 [Candidatus Paceibacterota bacterium]|nr:hypothetical protein [Candidatus Paceibacterota bacterium]
MARGGGAGEVMRWVALPGIVTSHEVKHGSWLFGLIKETHHFVQVHIDDEAYEAAKGSLNICYVDHTRSQIQNDSKYEVKEEDLAVRYAVGKPVSLSFGMSSSVEQWFIGTEPLLWKIEPRTA